MTVVYCLPNGKTVTEKKSMPNHEYDRLVQMSSTSNFADEENIPAEGKSNFQLGNATYNKDNRDCRKTGGFTEHPPERLTKDV